jgi:hypothetical protein
MEDRDQDRTRDFIIMGFECFTTQLRAKSTASFAKHLDDLIDAALSWHIS